MVWGPLLRVCHWLLVIFFIIAYACGDKLDTVHNLTGYTLGLLIVVRVVWGIVGTSDARSSEFAHKPVTVKQYLKQFVTLDAPRFVGHHPAGGTMIIVMLIMLSATTIGGVLALGAVEHSGPFANIATGMSRWQIHLLEDFHELLANTTLILALLHSIRVVFEGVLQQQNLIRAMITGIKKTS